MKTSTSVKYIIALFALCLVVGLAAVEFDWLLDAMPLFVIAVFCMGFCGLALAIVSKELPIWQEH